MTKPKIISIGAAVQDVFLQGKIFRPKREDDGNVEEFKLGSKNEVESVVFSTGGGATNAAVTFARQDLHSCYMGKVGHDITGRAIIDQLHADGVDTSLVDYSKDYSTGYSVLLLAPNGERTILVYRGASTHYQLAPADFHGAKADWFYLSSLEGNFDLLETIWKYAKDHDIKIAFNPGHKELQEVAKLRTLLPQCSILCLNKEELQMLYHGENLAELVTKASKDVKYVVGTDGPKGCVATDGQKLYKAGMYSDVPVVDRTGAGDAFCSGFTAMIAAGETMERALTFGSANSTSVVSKIGAKAGILTQDVKVHPMPIRVSQF
jgi:sugar/nucleoside kinase (ribokinase family)